MAIVPRTVIWRTAGDPPGALNRVVVTALPQDLGITAAGTYDVDVGDGVFRQRVISVSLTVTNYSREITATLPDYAIDLNAIGPAPVGATTYTGQGLPVPGVSLVGATLTLFPPDGGVAGTYTVRRSDDTGLRDLVLTLTTVPIVVSVDGAGAVQISQGADDPASLPMSLVIEAEVGSPAEAWEGVSISWTPGALSQTTAFWGANPLLAITSGAGAGGAVTVGGVVTITRPGLRLYRAGGTPAAVTTTFADAGGTVAGSSPLTITSGMVSNIRALEADGGPNTGTSITITIEAAVGIVPSDLFIAGTDGFALLPSTTNSFTSVDNATPAAVGDAVRFQEDDSGLAIPRNFSQVTLANRPLLAQNGTTFALDFDGSNDSLQVPGFVLANATTGFTLMARIRPDLVTGTRAIIDQDSGSSTTRNFQFRIDAGRIQLIGFNAGGGTVIATSPVDTIAANTWYTVCGILNSTNCRVWINDMTDGAATTIPNTAGTVRTAEFHTIRIGGGAGNFDGLITCPVGIRGSLSQADRVALATFIGAY